MCSADRQWGCKEANNILGSREDKNPLKKDYYPPENLIEGPHYVFQNIQKFWTYFHKLRQVWTILNVFWQVLTNLDKFKHV